MAVGPEGEIGVGYLSASFQKTAAATVAADYRVARFRPNDGGVLLIDDQVVDRGALVWPGDYHALVPSGREFQLVSTVSRGSAGGASNPTDIVIVATDRRAVRR